MLKKLSKIKLAWIFVLVFFILLPLVNDYGISWDEPQQREIGKVNYDYIFNKNSSLFSFDDKYYGSLFEVALISGEKILKLSDSRDIFLFRHYVNFTFFYIGCIVFFYLVSKVFSNKKMGFLGFFLLLTNPRILADSFYNSKDIPFLVFYLFSSYQLITYSKVGSKKNVLILGILTGLTTGVRLAGIFIFIILGIYLVGQISYTLFTKRKILMQKLLHALIYSVVSIITLYIFWPILWEDHSNFIKAIDLMKNYNWNGAVLFLGNFFQATELPWYYLPIWVIISNPLSIIIMFFLGFFLLAIKILFKNIIKKSDLSIIEKDMILPLSLLLFPVVGAIIFDPILYDGWRHFFFITPIIILIALYGLNSIFVTISHLLNHNQFILKLVIVFTILLEPISFIIKNHPHEYVYFNYLAGKNYEIIKKNFELDYWGLSSKEILEDLLSNFSGDLKIFTESEPIKSNMLILQPKDRNRIKFYDLDNIKYSNIFIGSYRGHPQPYNCKKLINSVKVGNASLSSAFLSPSCEFNSL